MDSLRKTSSLGIIALLGGLFFWLAFQFIYSQLNSDWYVLRDDAVITFSHAKNWFDFGFIGVSPSGERVEGYSAPVQFFIFALAYALVHISFVSFVEWQTQLASFLLGVFFTLYFIQQPRWALLASAVTAICLTWCTSFIEWHGSGMENSITHVLFAASVYLLYRFAKKKRITLLWTPIFVLASLSRLDGIYHLLPVLILFAFYWYWVEKSFKGLLLLACFGLLWFGFQAWRWDYFGSLASNTLLAQHINLGGRLEAIVTLQRWYFWESLQLSKIIFTSHAGYVLLLVLPCALLARWTAARALLFILALSLIATACFNPFLFGETRLDPSRSTTQMAFFVFVAGACVALGIARLKVRIGLLLLLLPLTFFTRIPPYYLCCGVSSFEPIRQEIAQLTQQEEIPRAMVANPDLGTMSWHKEFNILDLGMLGSPMVAQIQKGPLLADYFFDYVAPDVIESHETWSCQYLQTLFMDPRFRERYRTVREKTVRWGACGEAPLPKGIWVRRDIEKNANSAERRLIDSMKANPSLDRLRSELASCQAKTSNTSACTYVARTAYRFLPELRKQSSTKEIESIFAQSRSQAVDQYWVRGSTDAQAYQLALSFLIKDYLAQQKSLQREGGNGFTLGLDREFIILSHLACTSDRLKEPFFISDPINPISQKRNIEFLQTGFKVGSNCMAAIALDRRQFTSSILVGQWVPKDNRVLWQIELPLGPKP